MLFYDRIIGELPENGRRLATSGNAAGGYVWNSRFSPKRTVKEVVLMTTYEELSIIVSIASLMVLILTYVKKEK